MTRPGRIPDRDKEAIRAASRIEEVIGEYVQLRPTGTSLQGLCPFHDEHTPSFNVNPDRGLFHCFGCHESGDVFGFLQKHQQISFPEAVQMAADRIGYTIRYEGGGTTAHRERDTRARLLAANHDAAQFYAEQLHTADAAPARQFLTQRGFDDSVIGAFGCGFAPKSWDALTKHLRGRGYSERELETAGLSRAGRLGQIDRFRGRLITPIRNAGGDVLGFGARRLFTDDPLDVKYLNTPKTPLYEKSQVLFGLDQARRAIGKHHQAVVVEGYTDVMAMHAAGITHTIATCGTAFTEQHLAALRRILLDDHTWRAELCFLFDGDRAGREAAERAFHHVKAIPGRTTIAIARDDLDPCELRQRDGDRGLHDVLARRGSLVKFVLHSALAEHNLDEVDGRVAALHHGMSIVAELPDPVMRSEYATTLATSLGVEPAAAKALLTPPGTQPGAESGPPDERARSPGALRWQHAALQIALQQPELAAAHGFDELAAEAFNEPDCARIHAAIAHHGGTHAAPEDTGQWIRMVLDHLGDHTSTATGLAVDPLRLPSTDPGEHVAAVFTKLTDQHLSDRITDLRHELSSITPGSDPQRAGELTLSISDLTQRRRALLTADRPTPAPHAGSSPAPPTATTAGPPPPRRRPAAFGTSTSGPRRPRL